MKKAFFVLVVLILATLACRNPQSPTIGAIKIEALPQEAVISYDKLDSAAINAGQGVVSAVLTACDCRYEKIIDGGVIVVRDNVQVLYVSDKRSLSNMALFENSLLFTAQPGDVVYFGKVKPVAKLVQAGTLIAQTSVNTDGIEKITLSGGALRRSIFIVLDFNRLQSIQVPIDDTGLVNLYGTIDDAYAAATQ